MQTILYPTGTEAELSAAVDAAAGLLRAGELVAIPTETVYGLAANALDPAAVGEIFRVFSILETPPASNVILYKASCTPPCRFSFSCASVPEAEPFT